MVISKHAKTMLKIQVKRLEMSLLHMKTLRSQHLGLYFYLSFYFFSFTCYCFSCWSFWGKNFLYFLKQMKTCFILSSQQSMGWNQTLDEMYWNGWILTLDSNLSCVVSDEIERQFSWVFKRRIMLTIKREAITSVKQ